MWEMVREGGELDLNSPYAYLLMGEHFAETSLVAWREQQMAGFVYGYTVPRQPNILFVWQVGVATSMRRHGLGRQLLMQLLRQPGCHAVHHVEATITPSNSASMALFKGVAQRLGADFLVEPEHFEAAFFPAITGHTHESESRVLIESIQRDLL